MVIHIQDGAETAKPIPALNLIRVFIYSPNLFYVQIGYSHTRPSRSGAGRVTRITQKIAIPKEKGYESPRWVVWAYIIYDFICLFMIFFSLNFFMFLLCFYKLVITTSTALLKTILYFLLFLKIRNKSYDQKSTMNF